ncbi:MAG: acyl carrier protein [Armatimonadota bacterium]
MLPREAILQGVKECVAAGLGISVESVHEQSRIIAELGADSVDLLDLTFRLEERFGITVSPRDIERRTRAKLGETPLEVDGVYTPEALAELRAAMPEIPAGELSDGLTQGGLPMRFRVATMVSLVSRLLDEQGGAAESAAREETDG